MGMTISEALAKGIIQPGKASVHINRPLTNMSLALMQKTEKFIADRIFPRLPVAKQSDMFFTYDRGEFNRDEMQRRADAAESAGATYELGNDSYLCRVWALHRDIGWQLRANADNPINLDREATEFLTLKGMIRREREWVSQFLVADVWSHVFQGAATSTTRSELNSKDATKNSMAHWNLAVSEPIEDIETACDAVEEDTGFRPNKLACGKRVYSALKNHPDIIGRLNSGQTPGGPAMSTRQRLAQIFDLDEVMVGSAIYNSAASGATDSHSYIFGKHALLAYVPPSPGVMTAAAGYTVEWTGLTGSGGLAIEKWYNQDRKADRIELNTAFQQKRMAADLACWFNSIVA